MGDREGGGVVVLVVVDCWWWWAADESSCGWLYINIILAQARRTYLDGYDGREKQSGRA